MWKKLIWRFAYTFVDLHCISHSCIVGLATRPYLYSTCTCIMLVVSKLVLCGIKLVLVKACVVHVVCWRGLVCAGGDLVCYIKCAGEAWYIKYASEAWYIHRIRWRRVVHVMCWRCLVHVMCWRFLVHVMCWWCLVHVMCWPGLVSVIS